MIFSLNTALISTAGKVLHNEKPISYSWGNIDALHKWITSMNEKQIAQHLGVAGAEKYPLIWLVEGWKGKNNPPFIDFEKVTFYIACNSKVEGTNESRIPNFDLLYTVANDFIKQLKVNITVKQTESFTERANFSTSKGTVSSDVWDTLIVEMDLSINKNCLNKLCCSH